MANSLNITQQKRQLHLDVWWLDCRHTCIYILYISTYTGVYVCMNVCMYACMSPYQVRISKAFRLG